MQVAALTGAQVALRILSQQSPDQGVSGRSILAQSPATLDIGSALSRASSASLTAIQALGSSGSTGGSANTLATIKEWAKLGQFHNAANGVVDDRLRELVKGGTLPSLDVLDESQWNGLSEGEKNIYGLVRTLQGLYDAQPKSLEEALSDHVKVVLESHPESIARMQAGLASGTLKAEDGWNDIIAGYQAELSAAQEGRMQIHAIDDPKLVSSTHEFSARFDGIGWSGRGVTTHADMPALQSLYGTQNVMPGSSPYFGNYAITW